MAVKGQDLLIPTRKECLKLMAAHGMLPHIQEHSLLVAKVARWLASSLIAAGVSLSLDLIEAGALLHDLGKTPCLGTSLNHAAYGADILRAAGFPEVAGIVAEHIALFQDPEACEFIREAEVVNYADKRVLHTRVVPLEVRFADLLRRYGQTEPARQRILRLKDKARLLEAKLFGPLQASPQDLLVLNQSVPSPHPEVTPPLSEFRLNRD